MDDILVKAKQYQDDVEVRTKAHEISAEWHRWRGEVLGNATTIVSGVVGSAIFVTLTSQLGLAEKDRLSLPTEGWSFFFSVVVCILSILAPILSGIHGRINDAGQAATHRALSAEYYRLQQVIDLFLLSYADLNSSPEKREEALKGLDKISVDIQAVSSRPGLTLTDKALTAAEEKLGRIKSSA